MKKILSLVLALLMSVSAASFVGAADAAIADETTATSTEAEVQAQYDAWKAAQAEYVRRWYEKYGEDGYGECMFYDCMGEDDFPDDDYPYYGFSKKELKKLYGRKSKKKKGKRHRHYDDEMEDDVYSNVDSAWKEINFYEDIENELSVIQFSSIKEFSDYCEEQGIKVGNVDGENLMNWDRIHCCLDPLSLKYGEKDLITDTSYGGLYWTVADDVDADGVAAV